MAVLLGATAISVGLIGFGNGRAGRRFSLLDSVYGVVLAVALWMTIDLDYPGIGPVKSANNPIKLSDAPVETRLKSPGVGEHTVEIMREVGFSDAEIAALRDAKAIVG